MPVVKRIAFDELLPDLPFSGETNGMAVAKNVLPIDSRWRPARKSQIVVTRNSTVAELVKGALWSNARGKVICGIDRIASPAPTPEAMLLEVDEGSAFTDRSKAGGYNTAGSIQDFSFAEFNDFFIATWLLEPVQYIDASASAFADLITSTSKPKAKYVCTSKVHLILAWINEGGTDYPRRIWWSAQGDPQDFDVGSARSNFVDVHAADGEIISTAGFEDFFIVWTESRVLRFDYVGGDEVWHRVEIGSGPESMASGMSRSVVKRAGGAMYRGRDGYKVVAPDGSIANIGQGKIRSLVREPSAPEVTLPGAIDNVSGLVVWAGTFGFELGSAVGSFLVYNPAEHRFSTLESALDAPFVIGSSDVVPVYAPNSSNSDGLGNLMFLWFDGGSFTIYGFRLKEPLAYADTEQKSRLVEPVPGENSMVNRVRPLVELEEGSGKAVPTIQVKIEGWNDLYKKTAAFPAVTLDTDSDLNAEGWLVGPLPQTANRWEFTVIVPEFNPTTEYVPINLLGLDVEFDAFSEQ